MSGDQLNLTMCGPVDDDREYFAEISVDAAGTVYTWAEVHLDKRRRVPRGTGSPENARAVVRMYFGEVHFDVPYADVVATLDNARTRLLVGESHAPPE
jgi:hypothetical protein